MKTILALFQVVAGLAVIILNVGKNSSSGVSYVVLGIVLVIAGIATTHSKESKREVNRYLRKQKRLEQQKRAMRLTESESSNPPVVTTNDQPEGLEGVTTGEKLLLLLAGCILWAIFFYFVFH